MKKKKKIRIRIYKKKFFRNFVSKLETKNNKIEVKKTTSSFCLKKTRKKWICFKAFLPDKLVRMIFIIFHNYDKKEGGVNFIFLVGPIEAKDVRCKEMSSIRFSVDIVNDKDLENQLISFLSDEVIDIDYFINNKFKR